MSEKHIVFDILNTLLEYSLMFQNNPSPKNNHIAYIITPNFRSNHIEELTEQLEKNGIPFNIQK